MQQKYISIAFAADGSQVAGVMSSQGLFSGWTGYWWIENVDNRRQAVITVSGKTCGYELNFDGRLLIDLSTPHYFCNMRPTLCDGPVNMLSDIVIREQPSTPGTAAVDDAYTWNINIKECVEHAHKTT